jgi:hypothetical protein
VWNGRLLVFWLQLHYQTAPPKDLGGNLPKSSSGKPQQTLAETTVTDLSNSVAASATNLTLQNVGAVLYFSEYYNGSWQPTKSSDVNRPLSLGSFQQGEFDRSSLYLRPWLSADTEDETLYLEVSTDPYPAVFDRLPNVKAHGHVKAESVKWGSTRGGTGFALHNTHSAPVTWSDVPTTILAVPEYVRELQTTSGLLTASYSTITGSTVPTPIKVKILTGTWPESLENPQPDVTDQWFTPFFFGDPRSVFYVTTGQVLVPVSQHQRFGPRPWNASVTVGAAPSIPSIVLPGGPSQPDPPWESVANSVDGSIAGNAVSFGGLVSVIGGGTAFNFGDRSIGINSSTANEPAQVIDAAPGTDVQGDS